MNDDFSSVLLLLAKKLQHIFRQNFPGRLMLTAQTWNKNSAPSLNDFEKA